MRSEVISTAPSGCTRGEGRRGGGQKRSEAGIQSVEEKRSCVVDLKQKQKMLGRNGFKIAAQKPWGMV